MYKKCTVWMVLVVLIATNLAFGQKKKTKEKQQEPASRYTITDACTHKETAEKVKMAMTPYKVDKITPLKIYYKSYSQVKEMSFPIYHTTKYKFQINAEGMPTGVQMKITDKPRRITGAKTLARSEAKTFNYETPDDFEGTRIYLSIKIPGDPEFANNVRNRGCILIGAGYDEEADF